MSKAVNLVMVLVILHYYQYYIRVTDTYYSKLEYKI